MTRPPRREPPQEEIHARHILLPTEDEAKAALARVKGGEDFAKVATELSKDPAGDGGDLGWFTKDRMVPEFSEAAFKLKKGEVSEPVKTQFGWHIIKVEDTRTKTFPPFEQVKDQAARYVAAEGGERRSSRSCTSAAKIELFDADGKPMPPRAAGGRSRAATAPRPGRRPRRPPTSRRRPDASLGFARAGAPARSGSACGTLPWPPPLRSRRSRRRIIPPCRRSRACASPPSRRACATRAAPT